MKELFDKRLADKIREELDSIQPEYDPTSWDKLEKKLPTNFAPATRFPIAKISVIATVLLLTTIVPLKIGEQENMFVPSETMIASVVTRGTVNPVITSREDAPIAKEVVVPKVEEKGISKKVEAQVAAQKNVGSLGVKSPNTLAYLRKSTIFSKQILPQKVSLEGRELDKKHPKYLISNGTPILLQKGDIDLLKVGNKGQSAIRKKGLKRVLAIPQEEKKAKVGQFNPISISVLGGAFASYNHENQLDYTKSGGEIGALINIPVSKKFSVSSGLLLGRYQAKGLANPYTFSAVELNGLVLEDVGQIGKDPAPRKVELVTIEALLHSVVIPIKVSYNLGEVGGFKLQGIAGVNSYVNFEEKYEFREEEFLVPGETNVPDVTLLEFGREYYGVNYVDAFSTVDLAIGLERGLKNKNSYVIEPFVRLPLKAMGSESLKFRAAGISLKYNFVLKK